MKTFLCTALMVISTTITVLCASPEVKNGLVDINLECKYELEGQEVIQKYNTNSYYINDQPYTGWVEFGDGMHYYQEGLPVPYIYENEEIFLFDRNARLIEKTDTRYVEINNIIKKINSVSEPEILLETNNLKYLKTVIDILKDTGFDDASVVKINKTYQLWKN